MSAAWFRCFAMLVLPLLLALLASPAAAQWTVQSSSGAALLLKNGKWVQLSAGDDLGRSFTIRTLRTSKLNAAGNGAAIALGGGATATITDTGSRIQVQHLGGSIATGSRGRPTTIKTGAAIVEIRDGEAELNFAGASVATVKARRGEVRLLRGNGATTLKLGDITDVNVSDPDTGNDTPRANVKAPTSSNAGGNGAAKGNAGGNSDDGNSRGGGPGNANAGGNGNGNAGGSGKGNGNRD
ncbi:MAG: hypothetical protein EON59_08310 [Alphaproteobacteria bacterium]|nr:MAG: hypothetical protein EON59_08310 [Alphaproteobacteria bacterium]